MSEFKQYQAPFFILLVSLLFTSFMVQRQAADKKINTRAALVTRPVINDSPLSGCDPEIWKHVYNPSRLKVIKDCIIVSGVITESHAEADGDQHLLLKPDGGNENLLTRKNLKTKKGNLVIEAVCINNITEKKVGDACKGYVNHITIPSVGAHVKVSGSLVLDTHNGWNEIHPISKIVIQ
ncbi:MAG TPA: hypothetical protein VKC90_05000 [Chitinophagaceae bacterium]|nr:hypothetical protein [Chitinophagaceae bacterium]